MENNRKKEKDAKINLPQKGMD